MRDELEEKRVHNQDIVSRHRNLSEELRTILQGLTLTTGTFPLDEVLSKTEQIDATLNSLESHLDVSLEQLATETIDELQADASSLQSELGTLTSLRSDLLEKVLDRIGLLSEDTARIQLVSDDRVVHLAINIWNELHTARAAWNELNRSYQDFRNVTDSYVRSNIADVQDRFQIISRDVQTYFEVLEERTEGLGRPKLKLLTDQDRAVELEVEFLGERIYPAYRYLSESQLNSFGLAVFLASAKHFNQDFKFLILDDVINSFDGYKRPLVLRLLRRELHDHQILLLTHDSVWCDQVYETCPDWVRQRFVRWEPGVGPIVREGILPLEAIKQLIDDDQAVQAGRNMGPFLERQLQEVCEAFGVLVKYNQKNEYTLDPLLDRFRIRVKDKLGNDHDLCTASENLKNESAFRNLCAHWKNPDIQITAQEMASVVEKWSAIDGLVRCTDENCCGYLKYDGSRAFVCECGLTRLERAQRP